MEKKGFFIGEVVKAGWRVMKANLGFFILFIILTFLIPAIPQAIGNSFFSYNHPYVGFVFFLLYIILAVLVQMGVIRVSLDLSLGKKGRIKDLFTQLPLFFNFLIAHILFFLIIVAGLILLVFPAFIWASRYGLFGYFVIDKKVGPIQALKLSAKATMGAKWDMFGLYIISAIIMIIGLICLFVGLFAALPTVWMATTFAYRKLLDQTPQINTSLIE